MKTKVRGESRHYPRLVTWKNYPDLVVLLNGRAELPSCEEGISLTSADGYKTGDFVRTWNSGASRPFEGTVKLMNS